jgi:RNA recognition motif-containing protein
VDGSQKLYIGNVPFASTQDELREYFSQYSEVLDMFIPVNSYGEPRGFAFLTVKEEAAQDVIKAADGAEFMGRTLLVNLPLPPGEKTAKSGK